MDVGKNINPHKMNWKRNFVHWQTITCNASSWRQLLAKLFDIIANIVTGNFFSLQLTDEKETVFQVHNYFFPREKEREREKKKERKRTGETEGERPGKKFQTIACKTCASTSGNFERVSRSLCLISFSIIQLYNSSRDRELFLDDF